MKKRKKQKELKTVSSSALVSYSDFHPIKTGDKVILSGFSNLRKKHQDKPFPVRVRSTTTFYIDNDD